MLRRDVMFAIGLMMGLVCLSATPGSGGGSRSYPTYTPQQSGRPAQEQPQQVGKHASGREDIAYEDERDIDIHNRANRKGNWDYKQNWRYDRQAFYSGETQGDAYLDEHKEGAGGPGIYPDKEYLEMQNYYREDAARHNQGQSQR